MTGATNRHAAVFPARIDAFPRVAAFVEDVVGTAGFGHHDRLRLTLVLEELFTNTVMHGHGGDSDASVQLVLEIGPAGIAVTYEDTGPPFDPFAAIPEPPADAVGVDDRPVGGHGLVLVRRLCRELAYAHAEGRNRLSLVVPARDAAAVRQDQRPDNPSR